MLRHANGQNVKHVTFVRKSVVAFVIHILFQNFV